MTQLSLRMVEHESGEGTGCGFLVVGGWYDVRGHGGGPCQQTIGEGGGGLRSFEVVNLVPNDERVWVWSVKIYILIVVLLMLLCGSL